MRDKREHSPPQASACGPGQRRSRVSPLTKGRKLSGEADAKHQRGGVPRERDIEESEAFEMEKASACGPGQRRSRVSPLTKGRNDYFFCCGKKALTCGILIESKNIRICFGQTVNRRAVISPKGE